MTGKDLNYRLTADPDNMERGFKSSEKAAAKLERELAKLQAQERKVAAAASQVGQSMLIAGAAIAGGLVVATRAAIDWESAWAGVTKTVDGSPEQMAALEIELRKLAGTLPTTHREIAAVAEAAGQLGVQRQHIAGFTKTMIDLGVSTNLSANDAATALARISNIMGTSAGDVRRFGSALVDLGNNSATTEAEILEMALRIAGAGKQINLSEAQVLAYSAALSSVGVQAEAGGSAISRAFIKIESAVRGGGKELDKFAKVAGVTAAEFRAAYEKDAGAAINQFIRGLNRLKGEGEDVFAVLADLGMSEIRLRDAMLRLSAAGDLLGNSIKIGNEAWKDNNALTEEANRRYATTEAKMAIARNKINDFAITMGTTFLPIVAKGAEILGFLADVVGSLPAPVLQVLGILGAVAAVFALTGGAALIALPKIVAYRQALETLRNSGHSASGALGKVAGVMTGPWGLAIAGAVTVLGLYVSKQAEAKARVEDLTSTLDEQTGAITANTRVWIANQLLAEEALGGLFGQFGATSDKAEVLNRAMKELGLNMADVTNIMINQHGEIDAIRSRHEALTAEITSGNQANRDEWLALRDILVAYNQLSPELVAAKEKWRLLNEAKGGAAATTAALDPATRHLAESLGLTNDEAKELAGGIDNLNKELATLYGILFSVEEAQDASARALRAMKDAAKENGGALKGNGAAALENRSNVRALIKAHFDEIAAMAEQGASSDVLAAKTEALKKKFIEHALQVGLNEEAILDYAASYDEVPAKVQTTVATPGMSRALDEMRELRRRINELNAMKIAVPAQVGAAGTRGHLAYADGGWVHAPGGPRDDLGLVRVSNKEFIVNAQAAQQNAALLEAINSGARIPVGVGSGSAASSGGSTAPAQPAGLGGRELVAALREALAGTAVVLDGQAVGAIQATKADLYYRGG